MEPHQMIERALRLKRRLSGEPPVRFQVVGERCSGTNYLSTLIEANFRMRPARGMRWKHGFPDFVAPPPDVVFVVIFREVFAWLTSLYGKPWHTVPEMRALAFPQFIRTPWVTHVDRPPQFRLAPGYAGLPINLDLHPLTGQPFDSVLHMRAAKMQALLSLPARGARAIYTTHGDLVADPTLLLDELSRVTGQRRKAELTIPKGHYGFTWTHRRVETRDPEQLISAADRAHILDTLDLELECRAGFSYPPT